MKEEREQKVYELFRRLAGKFISEESNHTSLITVTNIKGHNNLRECTIFVTMLPLESEENALHFLKRKRGEFREYVKKNARIKHVPTFDFEIDEGEKNRQRIDEISRGKK